MANHPQQHHLEETFRDVFRGHPAGVTLITALVDGQPVGITATSVSSLSLSPLAVSFSFMKDTGSAEKLLRAESLLIHFLSDAHAHLAAAFSTTAEERFSEAQGWIFTEASEPHLPDARATMRVQISDTARSGAATLVAAEVLEVSTPTTESALLFQGHNFFSMRNAERLASEKEENPQA